MFMRKNSAFTMIEILIVLAIIGFLFAFLLGPQLLKVFGKSDVAVTKLRMQKVKTALLQYKMDIGHYPTKREGGIQALLEKPKVPTAADKWRGPYLDDEEDLEDKWGNELQYNRPPERSKKFKIFEIISFGADGQEGGDGDDAEIYIGA